MAKTDHPSRHVSTRAKRRHPPSKTASSGDPVSRMVEAARWMAAESDEPSTVALMKAMYDALSSDNIDAIDAAKQAVIGTPAEQPLRECLAYSIQTSTALESPEHPGERLVTELMAVPVLIEGMRGDVIPAQPLAAKQWQRVNKMFQRCGLVAGKDQSAFLLPFLYNPALLVHPPETQLFRMLDGLESLLGRHEGVVPQIVAAMPPVKDMPAPDEPSLWFMLGAHCHPGGMDAFWNREDAAGQVAKWCAVAGEAMRKGIDAEITVERPGRFQATFVNAYLSFEMSRIVSMVMRIGQSAGILPAEWAAVVSRHGVDGLEPTIHLGIYLTQTGQRFAGAVIPVMLFESPDAIQEGVVQMLAEAGLVNIEARDEAGPELDDDGDPLLPPPIPKWNWAIGSGTIQ